MAYSGFGMQSWIYRQKPRKVFSKGRKPLPNASDSQANDQIQFNIVLDGDHRKRLEERFTTTRLEKVVKWFWVGITVGVSIGILNITFHFIKFLMYG